MILHKRKSPISHSKAFTNKALLARLELEEWPAVEESAQWT
jgi:hypothetical protein